MSGWRWLVFSPDIEHDTKAASNAIPPRLFNAVMDDLLRRYGIGEHLIDQANSKHRFGHAYCIDFGGIVFQHEPKYKVRLSGPRILSVRAHHGLYLLRHVETLLCSEENWRPSKYGPWVRLHGHWHLCVVSVEELRRIRDALGAIQDLQEAENDWALRKNAMIDASPYLTRPGKKWPMEKGS